jgi:iron complex outermembrane receptor protein
VLIDGERIYGACPNHMDPPAFHVDFSEVDRIDVGKGPFDVKNQGSLGGVINVVTRDAAQGLHATGDLSTGSYGYFNPSATISYGRSAISFLGGYSYRTSDPYTDGSGKRFTQYANFKPDVLDSDAFRVGTAWIKLAGKPAFNHMVQFSYARQESDHVLYPYLQMDALYDNSDRFNVGYKIDGMQSAVKSIQTQVYFTQVRHWMTDDYRVSAGTSPRGYSMGTMAMTKALGGKFEAGLSDFTMGFEAFRREWDARTEMAGSAYAPQYSIPDVKTDSFGLYAEYIKPFSDELKLSMGGRVDLVKSVADSSKANTNLYYAYNSTRSTSARDILPGGNVRLSYQMHNGMEFSGGMGYAARVPEAGERYFALRRMGSDWVGNPALKPARNAGADVAFSLRRQRFLLESSFYLNQIFDYITVIPGAKANMVAGVMNTTARTYQNVDARMYGTEVQLSYSLTHRISVSNDYSYVRGSQEVMPQFGITSSYLAEMPPMRDQASLRYDTGRFAVEMEGVFSGVQSRVDASLHEASTPGYGIANLKASANFKRFTFRFSLNNVFDRLFLDYLSYQRDPFRTGTRVFEPGRNFYVNIAYRY